MNRSEGTGGEAVGGGSGPTAGGTAARKAGAGPSAPVPIAPPGQGVGRPPRAAVGPSSRAVLLASCPNQKGLVAGLASFIAGHGGNILYAEHAVEPAVGRSFTRIEWDLGDFDLAREEISPAFRDFGACLHASWQLTFSDTVPRVAVWVTRLDHCLVDLVWRQRAGELAAQVPLIVSNRPDLAPLADQLGIDFRHFPITPENKLDQEVEQLRALQEYNIDLVVLARYMQVLSPAFIERFPGRIMNIHHAFLPAFPGANPYRRAHERGVKLIGATAHYVTPELDEGPIVEQDAIRVSHRDDVPDLVRKGRDLERVVLARAVRFHLEGRVLVYGNKTVVFT